jgi:hypothetical protein
MSTPDDADTDADGGWRYGLDEVGPEAEAETRLPIEPGTPSLENAVFVALGALLALALLVSVINP